MVLSLVLSCQVYKNYTGYFTWKNNAALMRKVYGDHHLMDIRDLTEMESKDLFCRSQTGRVGSIPTRSRQHFFIMQSVIYRATPLKL
jgi:hypothetical protein